MLNPVSRLTRLCSRNSVNTWQRAFRKTQRNSSPHSRASFRISFCSQVDRLTITNPLGIFAARVFLTRDTFLAALTMPPPWPLRAASGNWPPVEKYRSEGTRFPFRPQRNSRQNPGLETQYFQPAIALGHCSRWLRFPVQQAEKRSTLLPAQCLTSWCKWARHDTYNLQPFWSLLSTCQKLPD